MYRLGLLREVHCSDSINHLREPLSFVTVPLAIYYANFSREAEQLWSHSKKGFPGLTGAS